jgi:hypothetical protein
MFNRSTRQAALAALVAFVAVTALSLFINQDYKIKPVAAADDGCQFFQETGFKICGKFLKYWQTHGGLEQQGFPISNEFDEPNAPPPAGDGKTHKVQYFQRARFEEHLENQPPYDVQLGLLGAEQYRSKYGELLSIRSRRTETKIADHTPKPGYIYLVVDLLVANTTTQKITVSPASITLRTAQIYDYKVDDATYALPKCLKLRDIDVREAVGGELAYEIPVNEVPQSITIDYFVAKATINL